MLTGTGPIHARRPTADDLVQTRERVTVAGAHGVYVRNALAEPGGDDGDDLLGFFDGEGVMQSLAWFGARGNLVVVSRDPERPEPEPEDCARAVFGHGAQWRIALGPRPILDALRRRDGRTALVDRQQVYYAFAASDGIAADRLRDDVRLAQRADVRALVRAALDLNESDLHVPAWRVHRGWLRDSVRRRVREQRTWVIGPPGEPVCKLDIGSRGAAGVVIEGVHTALDARGRGLASGLVASVAQRLLPETETVCLHVAAENRPARRAYEAAGMQAAGECRLLLRG